MNIDPAFLQQLQKIYAKLDDQQAIIYQALRRRVWTLESGWFNGRFQKTIGDRYSREAYPIPVISIIGLCDIEVHFDKVSVLAKLERDTALAKCFDGFVHYDFTARSGEDDTLIFYEPGMTIPEMKKNITDSEDSEIEFEFRFPSDITGRQVFEFADFLRIDGFYH